VSRRESGLTTQFLERAQSRVSTLFSTHRRQLVQLLPASCGFSRNEVATAETLAWSRIEFNFATDEALIEEIQSDWERKAGQDLRYLRRCVAAGKDTDNCCADAKVANRVRYFVDVLLPYTRIWQEAMLATTLWFIRIEFGVRNVFMHCVLSGASVKRITGRAPPRSIYSDLPRKFCFREGVEAPQFLLATTPYKRLCKKKSIRWNYLTM
jgi:hypothetical protein